MGDRTKDSVRTRKSNWTKDEINILVAEVESGKYMLHGKQHTNGQRITPQDRFRAWAMVTHKVNSLALCKRTVSEVKKKWQDLKFLAKRKEEGFQQRELKQMDSVAASMPNYSASNSSVGNSADPGSGEADCTGNMRLYLDCMETFQECLSDHEEATDAESDALSNLEWEDRSRLLHPVEWSMAPGSLKKKPNSFSEQLLEIEREKLKVKKEKLRVLRDMLRVQQERLAFEKQKQHVLFIKQPEPTPAATSATSEQPPSDKSSKS